MQILPAYCTHNDNQKVSEDSSYLRGNCDLFANLGALRIEVASGGSEHQVAVSVSLPCLDQCEVTGNGLLHHVVAAVEVAGLTRLTRDGHSLVGIVLDGETALLDHGTVSGGGVEGGDASTSGSKSLSKGALRGKLNLKLTGQVLLLEVLVLSDVTGDHALHLLGLKQLTQTEIINTGVIGHTDQIPICIEN